MSTMAGPCKRRLVDGGRLLAPPLLTPPFFLSFLPMTEGVCLSCDDPPAELSDPWGGGVLGLGLESKTEREAEEGGEERTPGITS